MAKSPKRVTIFSYQVGFGDCFLVRFEYDDRPRHILVDFGTTKLPAEVDKDHMTTIALDIKKKCGTSGLEAVVATHRHADHISGFTTSKVGNAPGNIIAELKPKIVLQPWTEQPDLKVDALGPKAEGERQLRGRRLGLNAMHGVSATILRMLDRKALTKGLPAPLVEQMRFIGEDNLKNLSSVKNLATMGRKNIYACHGSKSGLEAVLPGVKVHVLGPPTLKQTDTIRKQRSKDRDEFWHLALRRLAATEQSLDNGLDLFPKHPTLPATKLPLSMRWLTDRLQVARGEQMLGILRALDAQMNNTSLILLFEAGKKKLLFPGDAQIENWQYALSQDKNKALLKGVDLYKVGHHGSLNATPKTMWGAFEKKGPKTKKGRLTTVMSTMPGKHGTVSAKTEVPRTTLLNALKDQSELHSTHLMDKHALSGEVSLDL